MCLGLKIQNMQIDSKDIKNTTVHICRVLCCYELGRRESKGSVFHFFTKCIQKSFLAWHCIRVDDTHSVYRIS